MKKLMITLGMFATFCTTEAKVTLPALFTDNMVLQQKSDIILRGHSTNRKEVMVITGWDKHIYMAQTDKQGNWKTEISTPSAGGPYEISFCDGEELTLHNIMIGELWLCSGQSNMEMPVGDWGKVLNYENEIREATYPDIRLFKVKKETSLTPKEDLSPTQGEWQECTPQSVNSFSAVGYFFARQLQQKLKTPIGVIDCSWGGTPAEAWTSYNGLKHLQEFEHEMDMLESLGFQPEKIDAEYAKKREAWYQSLYEHDMGWCDDHQVWAEPDYSDENWKEMNLPGSWESNGIKDFDGVMWFRKTVDIPRTWYRKPITINLGKISDEDIVYYNGVEIGRGSNRDAVRRYTVPKKLVKRGKAVLTIRVTNYAGEGGLIGKPENMTMTVKGKDPVTLAGNWKYLSGFSLAGIEPLPPSPKTNPQYPTTLFNAMVHPITKIPIRGVIWYQGEANVGRADEYADLFMSLISDWRDKWKQPDMPFYFVQLANFLKKEEIQPDSEWAALREAQSKALYLNNTGMAVTTDLGEANNIHPKNKQEVGLRLSQLALKQTYKKKRMPQSPLFKSYRIEGNTIRIGFDNPGKGFMKSDTIKGFIIAGADHIFYPATVTIPKKEIIVESPDVPHPVAVRYNWADNPDGNLYGLSGLPTAPFRTDNW